MFYLVTQTLVWLILAFILGLIIGWLLRGIRASNQPAAPVAKPNNDNDAAAKKRIAQLEAELKSCREDCHKAQLKAQQAPAPSAPPAPSIAATAETQPLFSANIKSKPADDLKQISGVGPKLAQLLNELGIYHFEQVAAFNSDDVARVNERLSFTGRIERENWVAQAKVLAEGGETEFSKRYTKK